MPDDIVVQSISSVNPEFHARFNATQKTYRYRVRTTRSPFERDRVWQINQELNVTTMNCAAGAIVGSFDFAGFCRADSLKPNTTCSIRQSEWTVHDDGLSYYVTADRFLHQMVRLMVGTMVEIGRGQLAPDRMHEIISARDVRLCGQAAPPHGLSLIQVDYPS